MGKLRCKKLSESKNGLIYECETENDANKFKHLMTHSVVGWQVYTHQPSKKKIILHKVNPSSFSEVKASAKRISKRK